MSQYVIQEASVKSLFIRLFFNDLELAVGTGFIVEKEKRFILITAKHNVTGRHFETNECLDKKYAAIPNKIRIKHHSLIWGKWLEVEYALYEDIDRLSNPLWQEHPKADIAGLVIDSLHNIKIYPHDIKQTRQITITPAEIVSVIGFPFGLTQGGLGIWATGFMASEPDLPWNGLPCFLIDCRARSGQSGSPVVAYRNGLVPLKGNNLVQGSRTEFLGIYTGRVNEESDLGYVWKLEAIRELINSYIF